MNKLDVMAKNWVQGVKVGTILNACHYCAQINLRFPPKTAESIDGWFDFNSNDVNRPFLFFLRINRI